MWVILGQPVTGVAVPLWVAAAGGARRGRGDQGAAPLNAACDRVRALLVPTWRGDLKRYLHVPTLVEPGRGVLAALLPREAANFAAAAAAVERWRAGAPVGCRRDGFRERAGARDARRDRPVRRGADTVTIADSVGVRIRGRRRVPRGVSGELLAEADELGDDLVAEPAVRGVADRVAEFGVGGHLGAAALARPRLGRADQRSAIRWPRAFGSTYQPSR